MKYCPHCGKELIGNISFCPYCGKPLSSPTNKEVPPEPNPSTQEKPVALTNSKPRASKKLVFGFLIGLIAIAVALVLLTNPFAGNFSENPDAIQKAGDSVVKLYMYDINGVEISTGSGFASLDKDIIITNYHCIDGDVYTIEAERSKHSFFPIESIVAYDKEKDIAILRAPESNLAPLATGDSMNIKRGEKTVAIGSPIGLQQMVSTGIFSNYLNNGSHIRILSTASISSGSSGGALFNNYGKVIGITSAYYSSGNDLYETVPIHYVEELYNNRNPKDELTLADFYTLSEHPYDAIYLLVYGEKLHGQDVYVYGYITGMDADIHLVSSIDDVLYIDARGVWDSAEKINNAYLLQESPSVVVDLPINSPYLNNLNPGDFILVEGKVLYNSPLDVRITTPSITKIE